jgi:hypothetical protein
METKKSGFWTFNVEPEKKDSDAVVISHLILIARDENMVGTGYQIEGLAIRYGFSKARAKKIRSLYKEHVEYCKYIQSLFIKYHEFMNDYKANPNKKEELIEKQRENRKRELEALIEAITILLSE